MEPSEKFLIRSIVLDGVSEPFKRWIEPLRARYLDTEMGLQQVADLINDIRAAYDAHGYGLVQIAIPEQNLSGGELKLLVLEGRLESFLVCKNSKTRQAADTAFRVPEGEQFKIRRYEQGLDNIDRLFTFRAVHSAYDASSDKAECARIAPKGDAISADRGRRRSVGDVLIAPGTLVGFSNAIVSTRQPRPLWLSAGIDNNGSATTGRTRINGAVGLEDLLGLYEFISVRGSHTSDFSTGGDRSRNIGADFNMPFGYWSLSANYSYYDYRTTIVTANQPFVSSGSQRYLGFDVSRIVSRSPRTNLAVNLGLDLKETKNFVDDVKLTNSSRKLAVLSAGASARHRFASGEAYANLSLSRGLAAFGALDDQTTTRSIPRAQFTNVALSGYVQHSFYAPGTCITRKNLDKLLQGSPDLNSACRARLSALTAQPFPDFTISSSFAASWAPHALYSTEKVQIGGPYTVRGFDKQTLNGEFGGYVRNELSWYPRLSEESPFLNIIGRPSLFAGFDVGTIINDFAEPSQEKTLSGLIFGGRLTSRNITAEARVEAPIIAPASFTEKHALFRFLVNVRL